MRKWHRGVTGAVTATSLAVTATGCGVLTASEDVTTLKLVAPEYGTTPETSAKRYWLALAREFESKHPNIKIDVMVRPLGSIDSDVAKMVKDGEAPDLAEIGSYADYAERGKLYRTDQVTSLSTQANFLKPLAEAGELKRIQYGMPFAASTRLLFYNKDLFKSAGLSAPKNRDDVEQAAQALKNDGVRTPLALPLGPEEAQGETLNWLLSGKGGYTDTFDRSYSIDSAQNTQTFSWLKGLVSKGLTGPTAPKDLDRSDAYKEFSAGKVGMVNAHPSLLTEAQDQGVEVGTVLLRGQDGRAGTAMGTTDWITAFRQNEHRAQIREFLDFAFSDKNVLTFAGNFDQLPVTHTANEKMTANAAYDNLSAFRSALADAQFFPYDKTSWAGVSRQIKQNIGTAVESGQNPAAVLNRIARYAEAADSAK